MTAADTHARCLAAVVDRRALAATATDQPWLQWSTSICYETIGCNCGGPSPEYRHEPGCGINRLGEARQDDTALIVSAANSYAATTDLLYHILTEHDYATRTTRDQLYCLGCHAPWPCDLYRAAAKALGVDATHVGEKREPVDDLPGNE